jgi:hypothetical protein
METRYSVSSGSSFSLAANILVVHLCLSCHSFTVHTQKG